MQGEVGAAQERVAAMEARRVEVQARENALADQTVVEAEVGRALVEFTDLWDVLATPERERVIRLVLDRVTYDGRDGSLDLTFALPGLAELAEETA